MRNKFADTFYELARQDPHLCAIVADISPAGSIQKFREEFPERFINTGVAEQIMIGMSAGMALRGFRVFAYTIATFALYRPFEFIRNDLAYQELPVTIVGIGGGVTYSALGATHHAMEDVSIAASVPNMQVIAPCDPLEVEAATRWCATESVKPTYLRLGKAGEPVLSENAPEPWEFGKPRYLQRSPGGVCVLSYGPAMGLAKRVGDSLGARGEKVSLVSVHTPHPLDTHRLATILSQHRWIVVVEEESNGYLGLRVERIMRRYGLSSRLWCFSLKNEFIHAYGTHQDVLAAHELTLEKILEKIPR